MRSLLLLLAIAACGKPSPSPSPAAADARPCTACPTCPTPPPARYDVVLVDPGADRVEVIRRVREVTNRSLASTTALVDAAPVVVVQNLEKIPATELEARLTAAGATVRIE